MDPQVLFTLFRSGMHIEYLTMYRYFATSFIYIISVNFFKQPFAVGLLLRNPRHREVNFPKCMMAKQEPK